MRIHTAWRTHSTTRSNARGAWYVVLQREVNEVEVGFDDGVVVLKLGRDEPSYSMDPSGNLVYTRGNEVPTGDV